MQRILQHFGFYFHTFTIIVFWILQITKYNIIVCKYSIYTYNLYYIFIDVSFDMWRLCVQQKFVRIQKTTELIYDELLNEKRDLSRPPFKGKRERPDITSFILSPCLCSSFDSFRIFILAVDPGDKTCAEIGTLGQKLEGFSFLSDFGVVWDLLSNGNKDGMDHSRNHFHFNWF